MEGVKTLVEGRSKTWYVTSLVIITVIGIGLVALMVFLGIYGFDNPDPKAWYIKLEGTSTRNLYASKSDAVKAGAHTYKIV